MTDHSEDTGTELENEQSKTDEGRIAELEAELDEFRASNHAMARREGRLYEQLSVAEALADSLKPGVTRARAWAVGFLFIAAVLAVMLVMSWYEAADVRMSHAEMSTRVTSAEARAEAAETRAQELEEEADRLRVMLPVAVSNDDGYLRPTGEGTFTRHPWPDPTGYPAERFAADCVEVCENSSSYTTTDPGRALIVDPAHLTCVCFSPGYRGITRWINWEQIP